MNTATVTTEIHADVAHIDDWCTVHVTAPMDIEARDLAEIIPVIDPEVSSYTVTLTDPDGAMTYSVELDVTWGYDCDGNEVPYSADAYVTID